MNVKDYIIKGDKIYRKGTLAQYLDKRDISVGEPMTCDLPQTLNPMSFLLNSLLKNHCTVIKIQHSQTTDSLQLLSLLDDLIPSHQAILFYIDVDDVTTSVPIGIQTGVQTGLASRVELNVPLGIQTVAIGTEV